VGFFVAVVGAALAACGRAAAPQDEAQLVSILQRSLEVRATTARTFNMTSFETVFVDEPTVPLTPSQTETVRRMSPGTEPKGFLTFMRVYYEDWARGAEHARRVEAAQLASQRPDPIDVAKAVPPRNDPVRIPAIKVLSAVMRGPDNAYLEAAVDGFLMKVTFVRRDGRWMIAGETREMR